MERLGSHVALEPVVTSSPGIFNGGYPGWVGTRRVALPYVSSCPPLKTVRTTFMVYGLAPAVILRGPRSVPSHFASSTGLHPWTACAFAGYLCSGLSAG